MKKILILADGFRSPLDLAAQNVRDGLEALCEDARAQVLNPLDPGLSREGGELEKARIPRWWSGLEPLAGPIERALRQLGGLARLRTTLAEVFGAAQPDCVVSMRPEYVHAIAEIYRDHHERPFRLVAVLVESSPDRDPVPPALCDRYCVADEAMMEALEHTGVSPDRVELTGYPVSPLLTLPDVESPTLPPLSGPRRLLCLIHQGERKAGRLVDDLLEMQESSLTIAVARDAGLKARLIDRTRDQSGRVQVLGWTNELPRLLRSHHLLISQGDDPVVREAIAACCPPVLFGAGPPPFTGGAGVVHRHQIGALVEERREVAAAVGQAFAWQGRRWREWRANLERICRPEASLRIARIVLDECENAAASPLVPGGCTVAQRPSSRARFSRRGPAASLLCDFHIHTNYSDGKLTVREVVDLYGALGFDCICITDHLADPRRLLGKMVELCNFTLGQNQLAEYFAVIERERRRAWRRYGMLVLTGIEFNKDGFSRKSSAHLLGVDLKQPVMPSLDLPELIARLHDQGALAVASHPHIMESEWGKNTLYLWDNQKTFAPLLDAWEIANRNNIFNRVGLKRLPFLANSDFHKPKHIYSWKTLLQCEKDPEAIKECIRLNRDVAIMLFRGEPDRASRARAFSLTGWTDRPGQQVELPLSLANA